MVGIEQLNFGYGRELLFRETNLSLEPGNIYGMLGLNGAGKSTLLRLMAGLLFPHEGRINVLGFEPARRDPSFLSEIFVLPEELRVPSITGSEYVASYSPFYPKFDHNQFARYLGEFDIPNDSKLTALSLGQQKKFLLSYGLACNASLLILDEPTNGLDIPSKGMFRRLVAEALKDHQVIVVSTHQVRDVEALIDQIVILHEGKVLFNQPVSEVTSNLRMSLSTSRPQESSKLLFCEQTVGGFAAVWRDTEADDGHLDLELLFKAVISSPDTYKNLLNGVHKP